MVLKYALLVAFAAFAPLAGCGQSLFDSHGGDDGSAGPDSAVPLTCPAPCLGDAGADYNGTAGGATGVWRYLDDHRDRSWLAMTPGTDAFTGADAANTISSCEGHSAAACSQLPHALLFSTSGSASPADPAIEYKAPTKGVVQLTLRVLVPSGGAAQTVRLYRNSREDQLFTADASAGAIVQHAISIDALAGDRFLLAVAPKTGGTADIAVALFVNDTQQTFPQTCQLAVSFDTAAGNTVDNLCGSTLTHSDDNLGDDPPVMSAAPYPELGLSADVAASTYYKASDTLVKTGDSTTQLWVRQRAAVDTYGAFVFSDLDLDSGGGLAIDLYDDGGGAGPKLEASTCTVVDPLTIDGGQAPYPADHAWHFVRVTHTNGKVSVCLDGQPALSFPEPAGQLKSTYPPYIGKDVVWTPSGSFMNGYIDDVRVYSQALPCE